MIFSIGHVKFGSNVVYTWQLEYWRKWLGPILLLYSANIGLAQAARANCPIIKVVQAECGIYLVTRVLAQASQETGCWHKRLGPFVVLYSETGAWAQGAWPKGLGPFVILYSANMVLAHASQANCPIILCKHGVGISSSIPILYVANDELAQVAWDICHIIPSKHCVGSCVSDQSSYYALRTYVVYMIWVDFHVILCNHRVGTRGLGFYSGQPEHGATQIA